MHYKLENIKEGSLSVEEIEGLYEGCWLVLLNKGSYKEIIASSMQEKSAKMMRYIYLDMEGREKLKDKVELVYIEGN